MLSIAITFNMFLHMPAVNAKSKVTFTNNFTDNELLCHFVEQGEQAHKKTVKLT